MYQKKQDCGWQVSVVYNTYFTIDSFMTYAVYLEVDAQTYQQFMSIKSQLQAKTKNKIASELGDVLASVSVQVIQQVFIDLLEQQKKRLTRKEGHNVAQDSEKVIEHVLSAFKKYLPWSVALFGNERLFPMVEYFATLVQIQDDRYFVRYEVNEILAQQVLNVVEKILQGDAQYIPQAFELLVRVIDVGVEQLIKQPKAMLKFNFMVDKTLNGVIQVTTNMAYKRLEGLGREVQLTSAPYYIDHFLTFLKKENAS